MREVVRLADFIAARRHWRPLLETWGASAAAFLLQWNRSKNNKKKCFWLNKNKSANNTIKESV